MRPNETSSVEQLLSAGADPKIRNSANEKPEDLLLGSAKESEKGQEVRRMLRDAEAESTFASKGDVVDGECKTRRSPSSRESQRMYNAEVDHVTLPRICRLE